MSYEHGDPNGWTGVIAHGDGQMEIHPWETIVFENAGIYVWHNDKYDTCTFLPIFTVREVRWHMKSKEDIGGNVGGREWQKWSPADVPIESYHTRMQRLQREKKQIEKGA